MHGESARATNETKRFPGWALQLPPPASDIVAWIRAFNARSEVDLGGVDSSRLASTDLLPACSNLEVAWHGLGLLFLAD